jgi:hypothetical protein
MEILSLEFVLSELNITESRATGGNRPPYNIRSQMCCRVNVRPASLVFGEVEVEDNASDRWSRKVDQNGTESVYIRFCCPLAPQTSSSYTVYIHSAAQLIGA